ncbi:MAG: polysaccharide deacetylase family protein [Solirubrobacteraceae bacterium]
MAQVIRYLLAPHVPVLCRGLGVARTLQELYAGAPSPASGPATVAITFDDGPHPEGTPMVLQALAGQGAKATFFVVGEQVQKWPELVRRIRDEGHAVGLHGMWHRAHPLRRERELREDFRRGLAVVQDALGGPVGVHRPPFGLYSPASLEITRELGLRPLMWSQWGRDWRKQTDSAQISRLVLRKVRAGDVILLHDADHYSAPGSHVRTAGALPEILKTLAADQFGTVCLELMRT